MRKERRQYKERGEAKGRRNIGDAKKDRESRSKKVIANQKTAREIVERK